MNRDYPRVIPRDLFNESKLLKCIGRLVLLVHDNLAPEGIEYEEHGQPFEIALLDEGSLTIANLQLTIKGRPVTFKTTYNSKDNYPLYAEYDYVDYGVFEEDGSFSQEFYKLCNDIETF